MSAFHKTVIVKYVNFKLTAKISQGLWTSYFYNQIFLFWGSQTENIAPKRTKRSFSEETLSLSPLFKTAVGGLWMWPESTSHCQSMPNKKCHGNQECVFLRLLLIDKQILAGDGEQQYLSTLQVVLPPNTYTCLSTVLVA